MASINRLHISPTLTNSSCPWASEEQQLQELYASEFTGAITTRTATLNGFSEDHPSVHTVAFSAETVSSINSYGYSPHPLSQYLSWVKSLLQSEGATKPVIISITSSSLPELTTMVEAIQQLRHKLGDTEGDTSRVGIELNTSCPNIAYAPPPSYTPSALRPLIDVLASAYWSDRTLAIGLKLPPYTYSTQFTEIVSLISGFSMTGVDGERYNPISFLSCTNTLGSSLLFSEQTSDAKSEVATSPFALPTPLGGLAGESIHALSLGNVYKFSKLLSTSEDAAVRRIVLVGIGGVTSPAAAARMRAVGAKVVACATCLGREGVHAFEILSQPTKV